MHLELIVNNKFLEFLEPYNKIFYMKKLPVIEKENNISRWAFQCHKCWSKITTIFLQAVHSGKFSQTYMLHSEIQASKNVNKK